MINGPNMYLYCSNNPVNFIDPWGLKQYISVTFSGGYAPGVAALEGGAILALDTNSGELHSYNYAATGVGLGIGAAVSIELGVINMDNPEDITGFGLQTSAFAAAGIQGASAQISGTGPWGSGAIGGGSGYSAGGGFGISGMLTYTWYKGKSDLSVLPRDILQKLLKYPDISNNLKSRIRKIIKK